MPTSNPRPETLTLGLALIALGGTWLAADLGYLELVPTLRTWWPLVLVVWGALELWNTLASEKGGA